VRRRGAWGAAAAIAALVVLSLFPGPLHPEPLRAAPADDYAYLLAKAVQQDGVDYRALAEGRAALDAYVRLLATADPGATDPDRIAFWINAYNALVLQQILDTKCRAVRDVPGFFSDRTWKIAGRDLTLDDIEKDVLRGLGQPLFHFGLNCGSRGCPPLSAVLYRGADLAEALAQQARGYLGDRERNAFGYAQLHAELSMLFLWNREDFEAGRQGVVPPLQLFLADHVPAEGELEAVPRSLRSKAWRISFRPWDWSLNEAGRARDRVHPIWIVLYAVAAGALLLFGFHAFKMLAWRRRDGPELEIQVLDDSTDETAAAVDRAVARSRVPITVIRRGSRHGFKAGALAAGLLASDAPFVAVFDADFVPPSDFLRRAMPLFDLGERVGCVQGRWEHLNRDQNWLTRAQAVAIDAHFLVQQLARAARGFEAFLAGRGLSAARLAPWPDIDTPEDLAAYRARAR
jgi:hypothetical protein